MPLKIVHATCVVCRELLDPTDVVPFLDGYAHVACVVSTSLKAVADQGAQVTALTVVPRFLDLDTLRATQLVVAKATPTLSPSTAHIIISKSPLQAWWKKFGGAPREYTDPTEFGSLIHALLLGGADIVGVDAADWRTNKAKADRETARAAGKIPVLLSRLQAAEDCAADIRAKLKAKGYDLTQGERELDLTWNEGETPCRGRLDWWNQEQVIWLDLKIVADASREACVRHMLKYGAAIQHAAYTSALEKRHPELAGRVQGKFAFFEAEPPADFCIRPLAGSMRSLGMARWRRAVATWTACLERYGGDPGNPWPGYDEDDSEMEAPPWALDAEMLEMENPPPPF